MNDIKKVGITGASGVLGTILQKGLSTKYDLKLFDINESSEGNIIKCDFTDTEQVQGLFSGLDAIVHLAGDPRPNAPEELTYRNNFYSTSLAFEEARNSGVKKIVFASSNFYHQGDISRALQGQLKRKITLSDFPTPECLYGQSKVYGESLGKHLSHFGVQFVGLRIGWAVREDNPAMYGGLYMASMFCSHRDLTQAVHKSIEADIDFTAAYAISDNDAKVFDLEGTREVIAYNPLDNSAEYF